MNGKLSLKGEIDPNNGDSNIENASSNLKLHMKWDSDSQCYDKNM